MDILIRPEKMSLSRYVAVMGMLFAVSAVLNAVESSFSAFLPAGIRIGLSNVVVMAVMACINLPSALLLTVLKSAFVLLTRGVSAGMMSICGGLAAFAVTALLFRKTNVSFVFISVIGALAHTAGQLTAAWLMLGTPSVFAYAPVLSLASTAAGICTGLVLKIVFPQVQRIFKI